MYFLTNDNPYRRDADVYIGLHVSLRCSCDHFKKIDVISNNCECALNN